MILHEVRNRSKLIDHGPSQLRADAVDIIDHAILAADPYWGTLKLIHLAGDLLQIGDYQYNLRDWRHIYVVGAGKATHGIALALEEILGEHITEGVVILKRGEESHLQRIRVVYASHPVPDEASVHGARELIALARKADENDLVISAITGGSSALAVLPPDGVSLADKQCLNELLLSSGASIREINAVRKHVSQFKGGRLALEIFPAELIVLTVSDVVGDPLDYITDPTVPDTSTILDAWNTLDKYRLWDRAPDSIREYLQQGMGTESPKSFEGHFHAFILVTGDAAFKGAVNRAIELGYLATLIPKEIEGESCLQAQDMLDQAMSLFKETRGEMPFILIGRGETIVTIADSRGAGGPNQEFALAAALGIEGLQGIVAVSIDMDGTDGPTDFSGAIVDGWTVARAKERGLEAGEYLKIHNSTVLLNAAEDLIYTGPTGTNVNDLMFILMDRRPPESREIGQGDIA